MTGPTYKTYATPDNTKARGHVIAQYLQSAVDIPSDVFEPYSSIITNPLPVVFILNGVATTGKNEFVNAMKADAGNPNSIVHLSTIDPCREAVKILLDTNDSVRDYFVKDERTADEIVADKDDQYRDFLFNVKESWEKYGLGATSYSIGLILKTLGTLESRCKAIFIDSRETDTINRIVSTLTDCGVITLKILITNKDNGPANWTNGCDSNVCMDESFYDIVVRNDDDLDALRAVAVSFIAHLDIISRVYGISADGPGGDRTIR